MTCSYTRKSALRKKKKRERLSQALHIPKSLFGGLASQNHALSACIITIQGSRKTFRSRITKFDSFPSCKISPYSSLALRQRNHDLLSTWRLLLRKFSTVVFFSVFVHFFCLSFEGNSASAKKKKKKHE